jgi:hypothetical protein
MFGTDRHQAGADLSGDQRLETAEDKALTSRSINLIVKRGCAMSGLELEAFSAQGLRAGYLTEAARRGIALLEAMQRSQPAQFSRPRAITPEPNAPRDGSSPL